MDLIILNDGLYQLLPVTKQILQGIELFDEISCFDLCDLLRLKLTGYVDSINLHIIRVIITYHTIMVHKVMQVLFIYNKEKTHQKQLTYDLGIMKKTKVSYILLKLNKVI